MKEGCLERKKAALKCTKCTNSVQLRKRNLCDMLNTVRNSNAH